MGHSVALMSNDITPFRIQVPKADLDDLAGRLGNIRWPDELPGAGWQFGIPLDYVKELAEYWRTRYDWRAQEERLNGFAGFTTNLDGANVHFLHVRSPEADAKPLLLMHGWPGSIVEFLHVIGPLSDPRAYGGDPADAFHVVVPSSPGFGFSGPTTEPDWGTKRIAPAYVELMRRLGYERFAAHGGDWGALIAREIGLRFPEHVIGLHLTMLAGAGPWSEAELADLTGDELTEAKISLERSTRFRQEEMGYAIIQGTRPQTLAYGLTDSPVGQLAWLAEKFKEWSDSVDVPEDAIDRDDLLTNVMLYWITGTANSSSRIYATLGGTWGGKTEKSTVPTGIAVFPKDTARPVRSFAERTENIVGWSEFDRGGHFPALEEPDLVIADVRAFFRTLG